jgi:hypothetical protein
MRPAFRRIGVIAVVAVPGHGCSAAPAPADSSVPPAAVAPADSAVAVADTVASDLSAGDGAPVDAAGCVVDPLRHALPIALERHGDVVSETLGRPAQLADLANSGCLAVMTLPDLDGDGIDEREVNLACHWGTYGSLHILYFSNQGCERLADIFVAGELVAGELEHRGVRDLEATWSNGCAGLDFEWTRYRWDGQGYQVDDRATCQRCPDTKPPPGANRHSRCRSGP